MLGSGLAGGAASLTPLGHLRGSNGTPQSFAIGMSDDGSVVVGYSHSRHGPQAFRWTSAEGMTALGVNSLGPGYLRMANAVSAAGDVIVGEGYSSQTPLQSEAFHWTRTDGTVRVTGDLPGWVRATLATDVSADGRIVVGGCIINPAQFPDGQAFRWTAAEGIQFLGDFDGGSTLSGASAISADGRVIVGMGSIPGGTVAFRWTAETGLLGLGQLQSSPTRSSEASAVSADGAVIVGRGSSTNGLREAFRWTAAEGMVGLGDLPEGEFYSSAVGVSADGEVVVGTGHGDTGPEAFVWTPAGGMRRLWDLLLAQGFDPAAHGWLVLSNAMDVSADGRFVVGFGGREESVEAFLADLAPRIEVTGKSDGLKLSWPASFKLQRTPRLAQPVWNDTEGDTSSADIPADGNSGFFRLIPK